MLQIQKISMRFGGLVALDEVCMTVEKGEIRGLIGPNGSGKTTLVNVVTGFYTPTNGTVRLNDVDLTGKPSFRIANLGLCRTFQNINLFAEMSVLENVVTPQSVLTKDHIGSAVFRTREFKAQENKAHRRAKEILDFVGLGGKLDVKAKNLSYGQQRLLEIARALSVNPQLLLLDEPVAGMNEQESENVSRLVKQLREEMGITILLIEHHMRFVMSICDKVTVLNFGKVIAEGAPQEIQANEDVIKVYLGKRKGA